MQIIHLDKPRTMRLTLGAFRKFQEQLAAGRPPLEVVAEAMFASFKREDPGLTPEAFEDMLDAETLARVNAAFYEEMQSLGAALNPPKASEAPASTGSETLPSPESNSESAKTN